jgi:hypothetical protein
MKYSFTAIALTLFVFGSVSTSFGKAALFGFSKMVEMSEVIAVVDVTDIKTVEIKGKQWTYRQRVSAKVIETLKGTPGKEIDIFGLEDFICAQCEFQKGKQLVFLKRDGDLLIGANWHLSIRPIQNDILDWFQKESVEFARTPLKTALDQTRKEIQKQKK